MRLGGLTAFASCLLLLLTWLLLRGLDTDAFMFDSELRALDNFSVTESMLRQDILKARAGLLRNYDPLVRRTRAVHDALDQLSEVSLWDLEIETGSLSVLVTRQEELIEQFKSNNALLQNSLAYFGTFSARVAASAQDGAMVEAASSLAAAIINLTLDTSPSSARVVQDRLEELAGLQSIPGSAASIEPLLAHGRMLHDLLPTVDAVVKTLLAVPFGREQESIRSDVVAHQLASRAIEKQFRALLYAISLLLLGSLIYLGLRLRRRTVALQRRAAFEHEIAGISTRFINCQRHEIATLVELALGRLAELVGAGRAYFVTADEPVRVYRWSRTNVEFPSGWPERAVAVALSFAPQKEGIIAIPRIAKIESGSGGRSLSGMDVRAWLCVPTLSKKKIMTGLLGFDFLHACKRNQFTEHGFFQMACDAIANAVGKADLEREKERLEITLQQARRMETIGAFASGIAHNFNNILGGILGYTEVAMGRIGAGDWSPASTVADIRRAGERGRELVDQILTFGRRRDGKRERFCVKALLDEAKSLVTASLPPNIELLIGEIPRAAVVYAEPVQLQQVILNVCNNGVQATDGPGVISIGVDVLETEKPLRVWNDEIGPGRFVIITVSDQGRGMDEEVLERVFEPFFTTRPAGNGLGLATVREIMREHGGAATIRSTIGVGTQVDIWIPAITCDEKASTQQSSGPTVRGAGETVLLLEADGERLIRCEEVLAALGYEPLGFTDPAEALEACQTAPTRFDAALICHQIGANSALDLAVALHDVAPTLPIVLATSSVRDLDVARLATSGIYELVRRPLASAELAGALSRCLAGRASAQLQP